MKRSDRSFEPFMTGREAGQLLGLSHLSVPDENSPIAPK